MAHRLAIQLSGDAINLSYLGQAIDEFATILDELDLAVTGGKSVYWNISDLKVGSATVEVTPVHREGELFDPTATIVSACVEGFRQIDDKPERPPHFTDKALASARRLSRMAGKNVDAVTLIGAVANHPVQRVSVTSRVAANIDELIGVAGEASGAIEGRLEAISIHEGYVFTIYDPLKTRGTRCICDDEMLEALKEHLGKRLVVYGEIRYNQKGDPLSVKVREYKVFRETEQLPQFEDIRGLLSNDPVDMKKLSDYLRD